MDRLLCYLFNEQSYTRIDIEGLIAKGKIIVLLHHKVYDVTNYAKYHPAGSGCLLKKNGEDCAIDMGYHSKKAMILLKRYYIGRYVK